MKGGHVREPAPAQRTHQLQQAAGIGGDDGSGLGREQVFYLAVAQLVGRLRMEQVVDAGGAAAERGLFDLRDFESGNRSQQPPRLSVDGLRVAQVASVVVGHSHGQRVARGTCGQFAQNLGDVFAFGAEGGGARGPCGIVAQQMAVFLHGGAAAGGVDDDGVHVRRFEGGDHLARERGGLFVQTGVQHEGAAALLGLGDDDLAAFRGEHPRGGLVHVLEEDLLHATGEHAHPAPGLLRRGTLGGQALHKACGDAGKQGFHCGQPFGQ